MPSICAHMVIAKEVGKRLNINSDDFIRGNLLPDIIDIEENHHKVKSGNYIVPNIDYFLNTLDLSKDLYIGYLTHLLLDKHYLEDYLSYLFPNTNVFLDDTIYKDYDYLNYSLVNRFELNVTKLENILIQFDCKILEEKLKYNIDCLKQRKKGITKYLNIDSFSKFLLEISDTISKELLDYANKSSELSIRIRQ